MKVNFTAEASYQLGLVFEETNNVKAAFDEYKRAVFLCSDSRYLNKAGSLAKKLGEPQQAIKYYNLALKSDLKTYGEDHPYVATTRKAIESVKKALAECKEKKLGGSYDLQ
jgi:tetratricopeptide (TPR) repeat protein